MQAGLRKAMAAVKASEDVSAAAAAANSTSCDAERPRLPWQSVDHEAAALQLESARVVRDANPGQEAPVCAFVEVLTNLMIEWMLLMSARSLFSFSVYDIVY